MGAVKLETVNQGRGQHQWDNVTLNSVEVIDVLIRFRNKFDESYLCKELYSNDVFKTNGVPDFIEIISCLYSDLEIYIKNANLYRIEKFIIKSLMLGYAFSDMPILVKKHLNLNYKKSGIKNVYWNSLKKILFEYNYNYQLWLETSENVKIKSNKIFKICSNCKKSLERDLINFNKRKDSRDGYNRRCRKCMVRLVYKYKAKQ